MATYLELQQRVARNIIDSPAAITAAIPTLINSAMRDIQKEHNFKVMEAISTGNLTTVASHTFMSKPSNWKEARGDPWFVEDTDGAQREMKWSQNRTDMLHYFTEDDEGWPTILLDAEPSNELNATTFEVWPLPDGLSDYVDGEYRISFPYWKYLTALSANGDTNWFTLNADEYLEFQATWRAFAVDWDEERMAVWAQLAENERKKVIKADKISRLGGVTTLVPHWRGERSSKLRL